MKIPVIAIVLLFIIILTVAIKRSDRVMSKQNESFWEKEQLANSVRKKTLDNLSYITIPADFFNIHFDSSDENATEALRMLHFLNDQKIVNFTGITNTELKLTYGTANITVLTEYDQNYTMLARALQKLADSLMKADRISEARTVLEFSVETKTDVSATYKMLAEIYLKDCTPEKIDSLIATARTLNSAMAPSILRFLEALRPVQ
ncbi:MAG TPA: hypothetical protein PLQ04_05315 [Lachnospiraceae bacterium]|mgnify:CR=1 FL=1|nr:hypothetical protein [Lachnospiraceae bacterium]